MMNGSPLISVITPTLNSNSGIEQCLQSVIGQTYKNVEHIIVDGLSSDNTLAIVREFQSKFPGIRLISQKDNGIYDAMNHGIALANGEWLYFLGSDDSLYDKNVFCRLYRLFSDPEYDIIYGNVRFKLSGSKYIGRFNKIKLLCTNICHQAIFTRKEVFTRLGGFNIEYTTYADWHFNMRWFNDPRLCHHYVNLIIAWFFEGGHSKNKQDPKFHEDFPKIVEDYFPEIVSKIYNHRHNIVLNNIIKALSI